MHKAVKRHTPGMGLESYEDLMRRKDKEECMAAMPTAKELREACEAAIKELQSTCTHPASSWMDEMWAPGHCTGSQVQVCHVCEKILGRRGPKL